MKFGAIILAAGKGKRFKEPKQFIKINGKMLWQHVYNKTLKSIPENNIVVVGIDVKGGDSRSESVKMGLGKLAGDTERVIILEAARPLVTVEQINILLNDDYPSSTFVIPLVNTVVMKNGCYLNRNELYELLTPQAFDFPLLKEAYESGKFTEMTDETRVMYEMYEIKPHFIETGENLFKVTYQRDVAVIEALYKNLKENGKI